MKTGFIGAGKVGFTLGKFFCSKGSTDCTESSNSIKVTGYYSRNTQSAEEAAKFTGTKAFTDIGALIEASDVLFLTVPDGVDHSPQEKRSRALTRPVHTSIPFIRYSL